MQCGFRRTLVSNPVGFLALQPCPKFLRHGQAGPIQRVDVQINLLEKATLENVFQGSSRCVSTDTLT